MKSHCNMCGGVREHTVLKEHEEDGREEIDEHFSLHWGTKAWMLKCAGCGSLSFRTDNWNSESTDEQGRPIETTKYYPPRFFRQQPIWLKNSFLSDCPSEVTQLLDEAYICMQNSCKRAAAMAIRAVLERIMIERVDDQGTFAKNLDAFQAQGYLAAKQREIIEPVLEAGHASIHRGFTPSDQDLVLLFDATETLVEFVYIHKRGAVALKKRIPKRK